MKSLDQLEQVALQRRQQFNKTLEVVNQRTTLPQLGDDALELLTVRADGSPLRSVGIAGAIWLIQRFAHQNQRPSHRKPKTPRLKEERTHENHDTDHINGQGSSVKRP